MENEFDEFEEEETNLEEEIKETPKAKVKPKVAKEEPTEPVERYAAFYQEEKIGIVDTVTEQIITEGLTLPLAKLEAFKLNEFDKISIATGAK